MRLTALFSEEGWSTWLQSVLPDRSRSDTLFTDYPQLSLARSTMLAPEARDDSNSRHVGALLKKTLRVKSRKPWQLGCDYLFPLVLGGLVVLYASLSPAAKKHIYPESLTNAEIPEYFITLPVPQPTLNYSFLGEQGKLVLVGESPKAIELAQKLQTNMLSAPPPAARPAPPRLLFLADIFVCSLRLRLSTAVV